MTEWRILRGWSDDELKHRLEHIASLPTNFDADYEEMTVENGWNRYHSEAVIAREPPGPPLESGPFRRAEIAVASYQFSDPTIVVGHFDAETRLLGRRFLLQLKAFRTIHYLAGAVVGAVRVEEKDGNHLFGYRYDTLEGHIESGSEWFVLTKDSRTGDIRFRIEAAWRPGEFPNWWSRVGFKWAGPWHQKRWHHEAHWRLFRIAYGEMSTSGPVDEEGIAHAGPAVIFERTPGRTTIREPKWEEEEETIQSS